MSKYYGAIGYGKSQETSPGVWTAEPVERNVYGEIFKNTSRQDKAENLNDNISMSMKISFLADPYALDNFSLIKYATYLGTKWRVTSAEVQFPRLILTLGGVYNGE